MDGQRLIGEPSGEDSPTKTYYEIFCELFPYYLSIGMTEEQYWDKDCCLAKYYREAAMLDSKRHNQRAWLQGKYIYEALAALYPLFNPFSEAKPEPYLSEPFPMTEKELREAEEREEKRAMEAQRARMEAFMVANNKRFEKGGEQG